MAESLIKNLHFRNGEEDMFKILYSVAVVK